jgi:hypothetical protein
MLRHKKLNFAPEKWWFNEVVYKQPVIRNHSQEQEGFSLNIFQAFSKFLPIVFACDSKSDLNSIFFIQHPPIINVMTSYNDVIHILY